MMQKSNLIVKLLIMLSLCMLLNPAMLMADSAQILNAAELRITEAEKNLNKIDDLRTAATLRVSEAEEDVSKAKSLRTTAYLNAVEGKKKAKIVRDLRSKARVSRKQARDLRNKARALRNKARSSRHKAKSSRNKARSSRNKAKSLLNKAKRKNDFEAYKNAEIVYINKELAYKNAEEAYKNKDEVYKNKDEVYKNAREAYKNTKEPFRLAVAKYKEAVAARTKTNKAYNLSKRNFNKERRELKSEVKTYRLIRKRLAKAKKTLQRLKRVYKKLRRKLMKLAIPNEFKGEATDTQVSLTWSLSNESVVGFEVFRNGKLLTTTKKLGFIDDTVKSSTFYNYKVRSFDEVSNKSRLAKIRVRTLKEIDVEAPTVPTGFTTQATDRQVTLSWSASSDNVNVAGYEVYRDGVLISTTTKLEFTDDTVNENTSYKYEVLAFDLELNKSGFATSSVTTLEKIEDNIPLPPVTGADLAQSCVSCHGPEGQSYGPAMPSLTGMNKDYFKHVMDSFKDGTRHSTMMGRIANGYSSDDIELMGAWFESQELIYAEEDLDATLVEAGEALHNANCNSCHSSLDTDRNNGTLFGQYSGYLRNVLTDFSTGKSTDTPSAMLSKLANMSADDIESLASYYASSKAPLAAFEAPTNLSEDSKTSTQVTMSWVDPNTERKAVSFEVIRNGVVIANVNTPSYTDTTIEASQSYIYKIVSIDKDGVRSSEGSPLNVNSSIDEPKIPSASHGKELWENNNCFACHSATTSFSSGTTVGTLNAAIIGNVGGMGDLFSGLTSQDQADLVAFINAQSNPLPSLYNLKLLDNRQTLRKAMLLFAGRLPTQVEYDNSDTEEGLRAVIRAGMNGENWDDFIFETGNMHFQTKGLKGTDLIHYRDWTEYTKNHEDEPLEGPVFLLHYLADNDRPYTEMLTADYTVATRTVIEQIYGAEVIGSYNEVRHENESTGYASYAPARMTFKEKPYPHAGVMSMPSWLGKYPTTDTNRNRHRANAIYQQFLGLDIENLATRGIDDSGLEKFKAPLREAPACASCHVVMDPTAGMFQNWFNNRLYLERPRLDRNYVNGSQFGISHKGSKWYEGGDHWYRDSFEPGFEDKKMPGGYKGFNNPDVDGVIAYAGNNNGATSELQWLANEVIKDPRFGTGAAKFWYKGLFGRDYTPNQELLLQEIGQRFKNNGFIVRDLLVDMVMSELFRADGFIEDVDQVRADEMADWGTGRMLSTQQLQRKTWTTLDWELFRNITTGLGALYGGYDEGKTSSEPNQDMTPSTYSVLESRVLAPLCTDSLINKFKLDDSNPITDEVLIRVHIKGLVSKVWDEELSVDSEEVNRIYDLYETIYNSPGDHKSSCDKRDSSPSQRGWAAVGTYLLTDIKYVSE